MALYVLKQFALVAVVFAGFSYAEINTDILRRLEEMEALIQRQNIIIGEQSATIGKLSKEIQAIHNVNAKQSDKIRKLEETVEEYEKGKLASEDENINEEYKSQSNNINETLQPATFVTPEDSSSKAMHDLRSRGKRQVLADNRLAFTAYLDHYQTFHDGETVVFNKVLYNEGSAYNPVTGIFFCRYSGVYLFSLSIDTKNHDAVAKIVIDGRNQLDVISESQAVGNYFDVMGSTTLITHVNEGENVWVVQYFKQNTEIRGEANYRFTSFSGVLLY